MTDNPHKQGQGKDNREQEKAVDNHDLGKELIKPGGPIFNTLEGEEAKKNDKDAA